MKKINVMFLVKSFKVGGTEKHILNLASGLNKEKFKCVICCFSDLGPQGQLIEDKHNIKIYHNLLKNKFDISGVWQFMRILREEETDILYTVNSPLTQFWGTIGSKLSGTAACITRVSATNPTFHRKRRNVVNKIMLPFVSKIIAQAVSHKNYLINSEGMNGDRITVVYNGVELEKFQGLTEKSEIRAKLGINKDDHIVGIVARLAPEKGHDIFLNSARNVLGKFPQTSFVIIGDGEERKKLEKMARDFAIESRVLFLGDRKNVPEILPIFDIAVLSSYPFVETFSNAILEYMAAGKPVIATNVGSNSELVTHGETGFLIPYGDHEALAGALLKLLNNETLARKMGEAGRKRIEVKFTLKKMLADYEEIFTKSAE